MNKILIRTLIVLFIIVDVFVVYVVFKKEYPTKIEKVHFHAGFIVVNNNKTEDFSETKYQNFEPCKTNPNDKEEETPKHEQLEKAHLHDNVGDVVHVERKGTTWADLFTNLNYQIDYTKVTAYVNGRKVPRIQNMKIKPYDSLVLLIGNRNDTSSFLSKAVKKAHIQEEEKKSENCSM